MTEGRRESIEFVKQSMVERLFILQTKDKKLSGGFFFLIGIHPMQG